jgi:hypothetical protein
MTEEKIAQIWEASNENHYRLAGLIRQETIREVIAEFRAHVPNSVVTAIRKLKKMLEDGQ